jgi:hypothetical protein
VTYESVLRWREKHPDRDRIIKRRAAAMSRARSELARRHPEEFEALVVRECEIENVPRHLSPLPPDLDGRVGRRVSR